MLQKNNVLVPKTWGHEEWIANCEAMNYCGKLLSVKPGYSSSCHSHPIKDEVFYVLSGCLYLELGAPIQEHILMGPGTVQHIPANMWHQFTAVDLVGPSVLLEVSTFHSDADVQRKHIGGQRWTIDELNTWRQLHAEQLTKAGVCTR